MDNAAFKKYRNLGLAAIALLIVLMILIGERSRHDETVAAGKAAQEIRQKEEALVAKPETASANPIPAPAAAKPEDPVSAADKPAIFQDKNRTDEQINLTGSALLSETARLEPRIPADEPSAQDTHSVPRFSQTFDRTNLDQINNGLKEAMTLQEKNPGRYNTAPLTPAGNLYGIDTAKGGVAVLFNGADKWQIIGRPKNAPAGENGTYMITQALDQGVTIMNTVTTFTWRATLKDGKWQWQEVGGFPDDAWLHDDSPAPAPQPR